MPEFLHRGLALRYHDQGEGVPFIFLHGLGGGIAQILSAFEPAAGVRLITLDQQGHGESEANWETFGFSALADDAAALADHLRIPSFHLGGISMGAAVSVTLALRFPGRVRGLALVRPAWTDQPMRPELRRLFSVCAQHLQKGDRQGFLATPEYAAVKGLSAYTAGAFAAYFGDGASVRHWRKFVLLPASAPFEEPGQLGGIGMPTLVVANRNDYVHPFAYGEYFARQIPGARLHEIPDKDSDPAGHRAALNARLKELLLKEAAG